MDRPGLPAARCAVFVRKSTSLIDRHRLRGRNTAASEAAASEALVIQFERSQAIFEDDLASLLREQWRL